MGVVGLGGEGNDRTAPGQLGARAPSDPRHGQRRIAGASFLSPRTRGEALECRRATRKRTRLELRWNVAAAVLEGGDGTPQTDETSMKALLLRRHGGLQDLEVVDDHPMPKAAEGHVVIRVKASSFNYHDVFTVRGMPGIKVPLPVVLGLDMAGEIAEVGTGVAGWRAGDRVLVNPVNKKKGLMGEMLDGGMAEYCAVAADQLVAMPADVTFAEAAALPVAYGTAHRMLITHDTIRKGERVLVLGASGGVGTGCVILAKHLGAEVIACASSAEKMKRLEALGADEVINYQEVDFSKWAIERYGKPQRRSYEGGVDVVINFTGGDTWQPSLRCLKRGGKLLVCGATAGHDPKEDLRYVWTFELKIIGSNSFYDDDLKGLMDLIAQGRMKPVIDKVLPLDEAAEGLRLIQDREVIGKVIVTP
jgi:NADPH:quinone reductase-like Zn-dependent oxidoreductase